MLKNVFYKNFWSWVVARRIDPAISRATKKLDTSHLQIEDHSTFELNVADVHQTFSIRLSVFDSHISRWLLFRHVDTRITFLRLDCIRHVLEASYIFVVVILQWMRKEIKAHEQRSTIEVNWIIHCIVFIQRTLNAHLLIEVVLFAFAALTVATIQGNSFTTCLLLLVLFLLCQDWSVWSAKYWEGALDG